MKNINRNPIVWFSIVAVGGWWAIENGSFESFVVFILAVIASKQIEILSK